MINCAYNALSAISQLPYGVLIDAPGVRPSDARAVVDECLAVGAAHRHRRTARRIWDQVPPSPGECPVNIHRRRRISPAASISEIDHLNGYVVKKGIEHGIADAGQLTVHTLVKLLELKASRAAA